jgi:Tfp pilus assembly PilM family ATPase
VCLAQLTTRGVTFEREPLSGDVAITDPNFHTETQRAIGTALRRSKFSGKHAVSALPAEMLRYKTLRMPTMPAEDMAQAVAWEAAERFQLTESQSLQHYRAGTVNQGNENREEIIILAAEKNGVYDHTVALKQAGLMPIAIDATGAAMARVLGSADQSTLTIHLSEGIAEVVGHRGDQVIFDKPVNLIKLNDTINAIELAREVSLSLRYLSVTFGVHKPDAVWVAGHNATGNLAEQLTDALHIPVLTAEKSPMLSHIGLPGSESAQYCVALGLAMRNRTGSAQRGAA